MPVVLDTCTWIWLCSDHARLSPAAAEAIARHRTREGLLLAVISCWEVAKLVEKGKLAFRMPVAEWIDAAVRIQGLRLHPLTPAICVESTLLPGAFHGDPADQLIVATARLAEAAVVTPDRKLRDYAHVATIW